MTRDKLDKLKRIYDEAKVAHDAFRREFYARPLALRNINELAVTEKIQYAAYRAWYAAYQEYVANPETAAQIAKAEAATVAAFTQEGHDFSEEPDRTTYHKEQD